MNIFLSKVKNKFFSLIGLNILKQEAMLRLALREKGFNDKQHVIKIDHINGYNYVDGIKFPIIYPDSFFEKVRTISKEKNIKYYFNGNMNEEGERQKMLAPFKGDNSKIIRSEVGRSIFSKSTFNSEYYMGLSSSEFGLCPHQKDFQGVKETMWTYRFIECCMCESIPIVFNETPLGKTFILGFNYFTDEEILSGNCVYDKIKASENFELCKEKHTLTAERVKLISKIK